MVLGIHDVKIAFWSVSFVEELMGFFRVDWICKYIHYIYTLLQLRYVTIQFSTHIQSIWKNPTSFAAFAIKPLWSYGIELWGWASKSYIVVMQRSQSKTLTAIANAPRYVTNHTLHTDCNIPYVSDVIHERINNNLEVNPNPLLEPLPQPINTRRLKSCWPLDLQDTWGDIAGWIPYHVIAVHGIVADFYTHHNISL
jgi:hypothetical protein